MSEYALILFFSLVLPLFLSFYRPLKFYQKIKPLFLSIFFILIIFGGWDIWATYRGHWYFNSQYIWSPKIFNLPLEEVLFFIVVPFCSIFSWEVILFFKRKLR
ncbi:MAG: lycopene cyclase domain-containing protein [Candidatus Omnitrophica bacterium]|nr:lycopene cyclase domain-containing protein [Candidatus Omnitrophota bacterium]MCF7894288.1 lycopene cyclase domain-containing protein [Candidatus Omnitrophota bacterium]